MGQHSSPYSIETDLLILNVYSQLLKEEGMAHNDEQELVDINKEVSMESDV